MKKAVLIIATVAGYVLLETGLLLSAVGTIGSSLVNPYQVAICCTQVLFIPGMAVLISLVIYGSHLDWKRMLATRMALGICLPICAILIFIGGALLGWTSGQHPVLGGILMLLVMSAVALRIPFLWRLTRRAGGNGVQSEAARWLAERQSGATPRERLKRINAIRFASCIPVTVVLLVFLYFPQVLGIVSHIRYSHPNNLPGYRVPIPATWIIRPQEEDRSESGYAALGNLSPFLFKSAPWKHSFSVWYILAENNSPATHPSRLKLKKGFVEGPIESYEPKTLEDEESESDLISRHIIKIEDETITCIDHFPHWIERLGYTRDPEMSQVECFGTKGLFVDFNGPRAEADTLYEILAHTTHTK